MPSKFSTPRKSMLLGMPIGTAAGRLKKLVMFELVKKCHLATCYRCGESIVTADDLSIEHKNGWQLAKDPLTAFFDVNQIGFSHLICNIKAGARPSKVHDNRAAAKRAHYGRPGQAEKKRIRNARRNRKKILAEERGLEPRTPEGVTV